MFISVVWSGWLEGSISRSSLQFHFLQTLEHRTDVSVTSTSPWWEAPEEQGVPWVPAGPCGACWGPSPRCPALSPGVSPALGWIVPVVPLVGGGAWHHLVPQASLVQPCSPSSPPQPVLVPLGLETFGCVAQRHSLSCIPASAAFCLLVWS